MAIFRHIALGTHDLLTTANLFQTAFGLNHESTVWREDGVDTTYPPRPDAAPHAVHLSEGHVGFIIRKAKDGAGRGVGINHWGVVVDDLDGLLEEFEARGVKPYKERESAPGVSCEAKVVGPQGQIDVASEGTGGWEISPARGAMQIRHFAVGSPDVDDTAAFYRQMFGFKEVARDQAATGSPASIALSDGYMNFTVRKMDVSRLDHFGFEVDSLDGVAERLLAAGALSKPPSDLVSDANDDPSPTDRISVWTPEGLRLDVAVGGWPH